MLCTISIQNAIALENYDMAPVTVSSSRIPTTLSDSVNNITIISREQIESSQSPNVLELLRNDAGLHVTKASRGSAGSVLIRNGDPNQVLILIDGVKVNDTTNNRGGSYDLSRLNTDAVERIEIVKGTLSSIYGSAALSGVINIVTKTTPSKANVSAKIGTGSDDYYEASGQFQTRQDDLNLSLNVSYVDDGANNDNSETGSSYIGHNRHLAVSWPMSPGLVVKLFGQHQRTKESAFPDLSGGEQYAVFRQLEDKQSNEKLLGVSVLQNYKAWRHNMTASWFRHDEESESPGIDSQFGHTIVDSKLNRMHMVWNSTKKISKHISANAGLDYEKESAVTYSKQNIPFVGTVEERYLPERHNTGVFTEFRWSDVLAQFKLGARIDYPQRFRRVFSPDVGFSLGNKTKLSFKYAKGFKVPSFYALYTPLVGNDQLRPERSQFAEIRLEHARQGLVAGISTFKYRYNDLIDFDSTTFSLVNRSSVTSQGVELTLTIKPEAIKGNYNEWYITSHANYTDTDVAESGEELLQRPRKRAGLQFNYLISPQVKSHVSWLYVGKTKDFSYATGNVELDAYNTMDLSLDWNVVRNLNVLLSIDNLLDDNYEETVGNENRGRFIRLSVKWSE